MVSSFEKNLHYKNCFILFFFKPSEPNLKQKFYVLLKFFLKLGLKLAQHGRIEDSRNQKKRD